MNVTRKEQRIIQRALNAWQASGELTPSDSQRLAQTMRVSPFDWRRLSRYAFWTALACVLISLGSLFADSELVAWLLSLFSHSALMRILLPALLATISGAGNPDDALLRFDHFLSRLPSGVQLFSLLRNHENLRSLLVALNQMQYDHPGIIFRHASRVKVETEDDIAWSLDGEYAPSSPVVENVNCHGAIDLQVEKTEENQ